MTPKRKIRWKQIEGKFSYLKSDTNAGKYIVLLDSKIFKKHVHYFSSSEKVDDFLLIGGYKIKVKDKIDPLSIHLYKAEFDSAQYVTLLGMRNRSPARASVLFLSS